MIVMTATAIVVATGMEGITDGGTIEIETETGEAHQMTEGNRPTKEYLQALVQIEGDFPDLWRHLRSLRTFLCPRLPLRVPCLHRPFPPPSLTGRIACRILTITNHK